MDSPSTGNSELIVQVNRRLVLQAIRSLQPTYRAEVSRWTELNPATVTGIVSDLLKVRLLREVTGDFIAPGPAGGRPPMMLRLNNDARRILAIDLEPELLRVAVVGLGIDIIEYREEALDRHSHPEAVFATLDRLVEDVLSRGRRRTIDGIGLSLPGLVDRERGILLSSTNLPHWRNVPIRDILFQRFGHQAKVERAVHLAAMHEDWIDNSDDNRTKLILSLRTGIGMSFVRRGEVFMGAGGFNGEVGHTVIDLDGAQCECGNRGCLETFVSADAVRKRVETMLSQGRGQAIAAAVKQGEQLRPELVYRLAKDGDGDSAEIVLDVGRYVGLAAANLANLLSPDELIVSGSIDLAEDLILTAIREQIAQCSLPQIRDHLKVRLAVAKEKASLLGAAVMVTRELFDLPRLTHRRATVSN